MNKQFDSKVLDLVKQKGLYCYEYICEFEKFDETLLSKNNFYSLLSGKGINDKEYQHVLKVWNEFDMKDYHDLYLRCVMFYF